MTPSPIRPLVWLLQRVSSRDAATAAIGDCVEALAERQGTGRPPRWPALWINLQTIRAIAGAVVAAAPRRMRTTGLILRDATRALRAAPAHTIFIVAVLAAGITAGTVTFSVVDAVVFKPLPIDDPDQVVSIPTRDEDFNRRITPDIYWRLRDELASVESLAPRMTMTGSRVTVGDQTGEWPVIDTGADIFRILRLTPAIGRLWTTEDEARGDVNVAVLGHRLWRERFGGDLSVLGTPVVAGRRQFRVIGVLSAASDHPEIDLLSTPIWVPRVVPRGDVDAIFGLIARMRPGVSPAQVADEIQRIGGFTDWRPDVRPLRDTYVEQTRPWMLLALGAAALVVLVACVNAANLMLTRSAGRAQELAIRASLGASRRLIAATVLAEGLLLAMAATLVALLGAVAGVQAARAAVTTMVLGVFRADTIALNGRVLAAATISAVVTGVLCALVPAWQTSRAPVASLLKDAEAPTATGRRRWRSAFLVAEVAIVAVLLVVSWLFAASLVRVVNIELGIERAGLLAVKPRLEFQGTVEDVTHRIAQVPGVTDIAVSTAASLPLIGRAFGGAWHTTQVSGVGAGTDDRDTAPLEMLQYRVTSNYFAVAGLRFVRGGTWGADVEATADVVVLDDQAARRLFGDENPIGRQVRATEPRGTYTVVGTVPHVNVRGPEAEVQPSAYFPLRPSPTRTYAGLFVKVSRPPDEMVALINQALEPVAPLHDDPFVFAADDALRRLTATRRFNAGLMSAFGLVGVIIGAVGVYAVMAAFVAQQTREIGVRVALGATPLRIQRGVLTLAWRHLVAGLAIGLPLAWWLARGFTALLFRVTPADVSVYLGVAGLLCGVGMLAAWMPARRAARVDPIVSLRR